MNEIDREARIQMKNSTVISLKEVTNESGNTQYAKWCSCLLVIPETSKIRGSKIPLKGIISGNLVMYRKFQRSAEMNAEDALIRRCNCCFCKIEAFLFKYKN